MYNIGIDLGGTNIATGLVDEQGKIISKHSVPTNATRNFDEIISDMVKTVEAVISDTKIQITDVNSIGIGIPGTIDSKKGVIVYSNNIPIKNIPIVAKMKEKLNIPIYISNDANCAALGEVYGGAARGKQNVVMVTLGTGVGGGIIIDGKIYEGIDSAGAEIGHTLLVLDGEKCTCGRNGCVEAYASATGLIRQTKAAISNNPESLMNEIVNANIDNTDGRTAFDAAKKGDVVGQNVVNTYIKYIGEFLVDITNIFRPEVILLGGGVANEGEGLFNPLNEYVKKYSYAGSYTFVPKVERATLGNDAGIIGAAMLFAGNEKKKYPMKMAPAFKDYLWGGNKLKNEWNKSTNFDITAESWELSAHNNGQSIVENGELKGQTLSQVISKLGVHCIGEGFSQGDKFPILIKFIDAKQKLSIQVHPDDSYALKNEGEFGKTEMWYVVDAEEGSGILCGFNRDLTRDEYSQRIKDNTLLEVMNFVECKKGDTFFITPGTVHAIGEGLVIAEIQQNSDVTYRVSDYGRVGADGKLRELHIVKSIDVSNLTKNIPNGKPQGEPVKYNGYSSTLLVGCGYFNVTKIDVETKAELVADDKSFISLLFLENGLVKYQDMELKCNKGDSIFVPANMGKFTVEGKTSLILSTK